MEINCRIEYGDTFVRSIAIQCPDCKNWFHGSSLTDVGELIYSYQISTNKYDCPICGCEFGNIRKDYFEEKDAFKIEEFGNSQEVYKDCKSKTVIWE